MDDVIKDLYSITNRVDDIFKEVVNGNKDVLDKLDSVLYDYEQLD